MALVETVFDQGEVDLQNQLSLGHKEYLSRKVDTCENYSCFLLEA